MRRLAVLAALFVVPSVAFADVDVEVRNGDVVSGTLNPATETETFRVTVPQGAKLSVTLIGKRPARKQPKPPLAVQVLQRDGAGVTVLAETTPGVLRPKAKLKGIIVPASREYEVVVTGDGTTPGDYVLKIKWKQARKVPIPRQSLNGALQIPFSAEAGSSVKAVIKSARRSGALPRLLKITNTDSQAELTPAPAPSPGTDRKHKLATELLPGGGDFALDIGNDGDAGEVSGKIVLKAPKPAKTRVDVTGDAIGAGTSDDVARGRVFDKNGGRLTIDTQVSALLAGAALDVPEGALGAPTALLVGTAPAIAATDGENEAVGPTVFFGPSGQEFEKEVTVTLPFTGSAAGVFVIERAADGTETVLPGVSVDSQAGTVSFDTLHFTSYRTFRPSGGAATAKGDLDGDGFDDLVLRAPEDSTQRGIVYIVFGPISGNLSTASLPADTTTIVGDNPLVKFGIAPVLVADLDGDGTAELIVPGDAGGGGHIHIFTGIQRGQTLNETQRDVAIFGALNDVNFGSEMAAGDINDDGQVDLIVGAEDANFSTGAAYVFFGAPAAPFPFADTTSAAADLQFDGLTGGDLMGASVAIGDVTGNGKNDVVISQDQQNVNPAVPGHLLVFQGPLDGSTKFLTPAEATVDIAGEFAGDSFGSPVVLGDFNGDQQLDVATGARGHDNGGGSTDDVGSIYVFLGGPGLLSATSAEDRTAQRFGIAPGDELGELIVAGDVTADGIDDVIATAPGDDAPNTDNGAVWIFPGSTVPAQIGTVFHLLHGEAQDDGMKIIEQPVDLNGDGHTDLFAASEANDTAGVDAGAVYVVFASSTFNFPVDQTIDGVATPTTGFTVRGVAGQFLGSDND